MPTNSSAMIGLLLVVSFACVSYGGMVDLRPDENGDRIAAFADGKVKYLPAKRVNLGYGEGGSSGQCRYIKRSRNGDLYVTGPELDNQMFRSTDGGHAWTKWNMQLAGAGRIGAFAILRDDTFLIAGNTVERKEIRIARSTDYGRTWTVSTMDGMIEPYNFIVMDNGDLLELNDGRILMTCNLRYRMGVEQGNLEPHLFGAFPYVFHSFDRGKSWSGRSMITMYGAETHLLQFPSGKVMACIRKQRWHRLPGDPRSVLELMKRHGWTAPAGGPDPQENENANRIKNMFVSESYDGGYTWVNERQVTPFMKCSGDLSVLADGTLVLQYLHRYDGPIAREGIRARVSYDQGQTWQPEEYVLSDGIGRYPGGIDMPDGSMISICPYAGQLQAVHWRALPSAKDH